MAKASGDEIVPFEQAVAEIEGERRWVIPSICCGELRKSWLNCPPVSMSVCAMPFEHLPTIPGLRTAASWEDAKGGVFE